jgi:hypothetical protein
MWRTCTNYRQKSHKIMSFPFGCIKHKFFLCYPHFFQGLDPVSSPSVPVADRRGEKVNVGFSDFGAGGSNQLRDPCLRGSASNDRKFSLGNEFHMGPLLYQRTLCFIRGSGNGKENCVTLEITSHDSLGEKNFKHLNACWRYALQPTF